MRLPTAQRRVASLVSPEAWFEGLLGLLTGLFSWLLKLIMHSVAPANAPKLPALKLPAPVLEISPTSSIVDLAAHEQHVETLEMTVSTPSSPCSDSQPIDGAGIPLHRRRDPMCKRNAAEPLDRDTRDDAAVEPNRGARLR